MRRPEETDPTFPPQLLAPRSTGTHGHSVGSPRFSNHSLFHAMRFGNTIPDDFSDTDPIRI